MSTTNKLRTTAASFFVSAALASCVPASEPSPPAGAGGVQTESSPAARGEAFVSRDGWRVTIDKLIVRAGPQVQSHVPDRFGYAGYARSQPAIFNAKDSGLQIYAPEIPPGKATLLMGYDQYSIYIGPEYEPYDDYADVLGSVTPADAARFQQIADQGFNTEDGKNYGFIWGQGPSVLIELRASRDGVHEVKLKAAVSAQYSSSSIDIEKSGGDGDEDEGIGNGAVPGPVGSKGGLSARGGIEIEIRANALALCRLEITPEKAFTTLGPDGIDIGRFLAADKDNDGEVTGAELVTVEVDPEEISTRPSDKPPTLLDLFTEKLSKHLLTTRPL